MADRTFTVRIGNVGADVAAYVERDSTTVPVDATSGGKRLTFVSFKDQGYGGNGTDLNSVADGHYTVATLSDATNAAPIVLTMTATAAALGWVAGDYITVENVLGNTNANGTFKLTSVSGSTATLEGSAGNAAYTSGGRAWEINKGKGYHSVLRQVMQAILDEKSLNG